ncbi:MAG: EF-P lysine aminoacylase GenX [Deltaproteobacteria bacterium]|nr:EF-P lysine aminoacylase GenX [Deltaproteobacteria bacterium]MCB9785965.1 EF-P lysine aminoacylase GenX [Deltaproteobacteria bacterium]
MTRSGRPRGRVLSVQGDTAWLQAPGGALLRVEAVPGARPGDLVEDGAVVFRHPTGVWPQAGTDGARFADPERWRRLEQRAELLSRTRSFFEARGFLAVETPLVVDSPGTEVHIAPTAVLQSRSPGEPETRRWLIPSPELHMKRLVAGGAGPIYQLTRVFRDGERGRNHRAEFSMLEWYRPWAGIDALMDDCEQWLRSLAPNGIERRGRRIDLQAPWSRIGFFEALAQRAHIDAPERLDPDAQLAAFVEHVEPTLGQDRPEFLTDWPIALASLARANPRDPRVAERFELFIGGLELANAFGELSDAEEQRRRCVAENAERRALGLPELPLDEAFLDALTQGLPPTAGIAVGLDRVVMLVTGAEDIDEVLAF